MIVEKLMEEKRKRIKLWPVKSNRASDLGHECLRYLVLNRTRWQEKILHDVRLQAIFDEGNLHERAVLRDLDNAGFTVIEQQKAFEWKEYNITGHIDGKLLIESYAVPIEIKSSSPFVFQTLHDIRSLTHGKYHYLRKYPAQMTLYLLMDEKEYGFFLFKNKQTGEIKEIRIDLDYDLGESLLKKAEVVNKHVEDGTTPPPMPYDEQICGSCGFFHVCLPEVKRDALELQTDPELEASLNRFFELKPMKSEYEKLDQLIKARFKEQEKVVMGNYLVLGKWVERQGFTVKSSRYWKCNIKSLEVKNGTSS